MAYRKLAAAASVAALLVGGSACATASASSDQGGRLWSRTFEHGNGSMQAWYGVKDVGRTGATARNGDHALAVDGKGNWGIEEQWPGQHAVKPGKTYRLTGWLKVSPHSAQDVTVSAFFGGKGTAKVDVVHATAKWAKYSGTVTAPKGASTVGLRYQGGRTTHFYLDGVTAYRGDKAAGKADGGTSHAPARKKADHSRSAKPAKHGGDSHGPSKAKGHVCKNPDDVFHGKGSQGLGKYYADASLWHAGGYDISQAMGVCSHHSWRVKVSAADHQDGAVLSYPNVHRDFHNWSTGHEPRLDSFDSITSRFAHRAPDKGKYDVAYDIWLNGVASKGSTELMIWTEHNGQQPAGSKLGTVTVDGHKWQLWATGDDKYIAFVSTDPLTSGKLNLQAFTERLTHHGRLAGDSTLGQVDYGVEVVSTHGKQERFDVTKFAVHTS